MLREGDGDCESNDFACGAGLVCGFYNCHRYHNTSGWAAQDEASLPSFSFSDDCCEVPEEVEADCSALSFDFVCNATADTPVAVSFVATSIGWGWGLGHYGASGWVVYDNATSDAELWSPPREKAWQTSVLPGSVTVTDSGVHTVSVRERYQTMRLKELRFLTGQGACRFGTSVTAAAPAPSKYFNHWSQTSNPVDSGAVTGYTVKDGGVHMASVGWGGLVNSEIAGGAATSLLDGSVNPRGGADWQRFTLGTSDWIRGHLVDRSMEVAELYACNENVWTEEEFAEEMAGDTEDTCYAAIFVGARCYSSGGIYRVDQEAWSAAGFADVTCGSTVEYFLNQDADHLSSRSALSTTPT
jgi:hypothetical protein